MIRIRCQCGKNLKLPQEQVGKTATCPQCKKKVRVVAAEHTPDGWNATNFFIIQGGPQQVGEQVFPAGRQAISIGKGEEACLCLRAASVSRLHCRLAPEGDGWRVEDQKSTNGLYVNGLRVQKHVLRDGDIVRVGDFELRYVSPRPSPSSGKRADSGDATALGASGATGSLTILDDIAKELTGPIPAPSGKTATPGKPANPWPEEDFKFTDDTGDKTKKSGPGGPVRNAEGKPVCPRCAKALLENAVICVHCGLDLRTGKRLMAGHSHAEEFSGPPENPKALSNYLKDCLWSFAFFTNPGNIIRFIVIAVTFLLREWLLSLPLPGFLTLSGLFLLIFVYVAMNGVICAYLFNAVINASGGDDDLPEISMQDGLLDGFIFPFFKFLGTGILAFLPVIIYEIILYNSPTSSAWSEEIMWALKVWGAFCWPIMVLAAAVGGIDSLLRPDLLARTVLQTFVPYVVTCLLTAGAISLTYFAQNLAALSSKPAAVELALSVLNIYCLLVAMRCIGLYYHHFKSRFAWSWG